METTELPSGGATGVTENRVRQRRRAAALSQQQLAGRVGVTRQAIGAIEAGQYSPATSVALRLARALHCRVEDLFMLVEGEPLVEGRWVGGLVASSPRVKMFRVAGRVFVQSVDTLGGLLSFNEPADGLVSVSRTKAGSARVRLLRDVAALDRRIAVAGCNPAMFLARNYFGRPPHDDGLLVCMMNSETALAALKRGEVHVAGLHVIDARSGECNLPYLRRQLRGRDYSVVTFASWEEGLLVTRGNPKKIRRIGDLAGRRVRFVNRESGSGARQLLDRQLAGAGLQSSEVRGYSRTVSSHLESGWCVKQGLADAGIGVRAVARALGLDFIPLQEARYDLVFPKAYLEIHPALKTLLEVLASRPFRAEVDALGGFDTREMGKIPTVAPA